MYTCSKKIIENETIGIKIKIYNHLKKYILFCTILGFCAGYKFINKNIYTIFINKNIYTIFININIIQYVLLTIFL